MKYVEVRTQSELDKALKKVQSGEIVVCVGSGHFRVGESSRVEARESSSVEAWESSSVVAWESSSVEAWESSSVEAWGSSSVVARESSSVVARESSSVVAWGSSSVVAWANVAIQRHGKTPKIQGGVLVQIPEITTAKEWLDYYGLKATRGIVTLYKAVGQDWVSSRNMAYPPGSTPEAPDWDGGKAECGGGLHFAFHPVAAEQFHSGDAPRFVGCPVRVSEIVVHKGAQYPQKVKAPHVVKPGCFEVDRHGDPLSPDGTKASS